jgi:hypothetical protein
MTASPYFPRSPIGLQGHTQIAGDWSLGADSRHGPRPCGLAALSTIPIATNMTDSQDHHWDRFVRVRRSPAVRRPGCGAAPEAHRAPSRPAHAAGLKHQAQALRSDVATPCDDVKKEFERVKKEFAPGDTIDPDSQTHDTPAEDTRIRQTPPGSPATRTAPDRYAELDDAANADAPDAVVTRQVRRPWADRAEGIGT